MPDPTQQQEELGETRMDHVGLSVGDLDGLATWYREAFGLEEESRYGYRTGSSDVAGIVLLSPHGWRLELQHCPGSTPAQPSDPLEALLRQGFGHICIGVDDIDAAFELLVARGAGVMFPPRPTALPHITVSYLTDPEGNPIELLSRAGGASPERQA
jgi:catechol 2,3-dioxygenase-like lactoylglutathione lyase family enzyme